MLGRIVVFRDVIIKSQLQHVRKLTALLFVIINIPSVFSCTWNRSECNETFFKQQVTDFGICYTFNYWDDESKVLTSDSPGNVLICILRY